MKNFRIKSRHTISKIPWTTNAYVYHHFFSTKQTESSDVNVNQWQWYRRHSRRMKWGMKSNTFCCIAVQHVETLFHNARDLVSNLDLRRCPCGVCIIFLCMYCQKMVHFTLAWVKLYLPFPLLLSHWSKDSKKINGGK